MFEKTLFTDETTLSSRRAEVYDWLTSNASEYFSSIESISDDESDENISGAIVCTLSQGGKIILGYKPYAATYALKILSKSGSVLCQSESRSGNIIDKHNYGIKTENGIYVHGRADYSTNGSFMMSKATDGTIVISAARHNLGSDTAFYLVIPEKNIVYKIKSSNEDCFFKEAERMSFASIPVGANDSVENMFIVPFTPNINTICKAVDSDGQHYFYDGLCALKYEE